MRKKILLITIFGALAAFPLLAYRYRSYLLFYLFNPVEVSHIELATLEPGKSHKVCEGRNKCLVVFMTPWCPECIDHISSLKEIYAATKPTDKAGFVVVIGWDTKEAIEAMASSIPFPVLLDSKGEFYQVANVTSVPAWYIYQDGTIIKEIKHHSDSSSLEEGFDQFYNTLYSSQFKKSEKKG
jgi:hypothetical protein